MPGRNTYCLEAVEQARGSSREQEFCWPQGAGPDSSEGAMRCWFQLPTAGEPTAPIVSGLRHQCSLPGSGSRDLSRAGRGRPTSAGELSRGRGPGPFPVARASPSVAASFREGADKRASPNVQTIVQLPLGSRWLVSRTQFPSEGGRRTL